ncbi:MAG: hypothetical protein ACLGHQ_16105 [Acidimicrobiia bacterium]
MFELDPAAPNIIPVKYRQVALSHVPPDLELDETSLRAYYVGKEAYMRTRFIVVRRGADTAFVEVDRPPSDELFSNITDLRLLAGPDDCAYVHEPEIDVGIPAQLALVADRCPGRSCIVVEGRYSHVSFLLNPEPLRITVIDIVPPEPSKLMDQALRLLAVAEDLPPIVLTSEVIDSRELLAAEPVEAADVLLPCQATGMDFGDVDVAFLDQRPERSDWTLLGCERTRQIHQWFYGTSARSIDTCPRRFLSDARDAAGVTLTRCCLLQEGLEQQRRTVIVPWGATLAEVREGLLAMIATERFAWTPT